MNCPPPPGTNIINVVAVGPPLGAIIAPLLPAIIPPGGAWWPWGAIIIAPGWCASVKPPPAEGIK